MPDGDDLDTRFNELVRQIDAEEQRRMRTAAARAAKETRAARRTRPPRSSPRGGLSGHGDEPPRRIGRVWLAMAAITTVITAAGLVVIFRPDLLGPSGAPPEAIPPAVADAESDAEAAAEAAAEAEAAADPNVNPNADPNPDANPSPDAGTGADRVGNPFAGSPAEHYADGIAGFAMPAPKAMGGLSKKQVAEGLERTRELLAAAYLDTRTLLGGEPDAFAKLLHRDQRDWFRDGLDERRNSTRSWVNSFAPGSAALTTDVIKVKGEVRLDTFKDGDTRGVAVKLNHLIVYAVHRPGQPLTTIRVVAHAIGEVRLHRAPGMPAVWVRRFGAQVTPARCDVSDGYHHPVYRDSPEGGTPATGAPVDPYVLREPETGTGCRRALPT